MAFKKIIPTLPVMIPKPGEKLALIGQNGRGKTYFAERVIGPYFGKQQIVVADLKGDDMWDGLDSVIVHTMGELISRSFPKYPLIILRPDKSIVHDFDALDDVFAWVYERGHTLLVIDEVSAMVKGPTQFGHGLVDLLQRGRLRKCTVVMGMQRPSWVPRMILSESQKFVLFYLTDERDRRTVAAASHYTLAREVPDLHGFYFVDTVQGLVGYSAGLTV